jgi:hypothetical protein
MPDNRQPEADPLFPKWARATVEKLRPLMRFGSYQMNFGHGVGQQLTIKVTLRESDAKELGISF